jgi:hypothetical protein
MVAYLVKRNKVTSGSGETGRNFRKMEEGT